MAKMRRVEQPLAVVRLTILIGLYALDVRDVYDKLVWLGPTESYSFAVAYKQAFAAKSLPTPAFLNVSQVYSAPVESGAELLRPSGWSSYYEKCSTLYATNEQDEGIHTIKAIDCELERASASTPRVATDLILSAGLRVDSVAWVSCQLLFFHRRPPLCQENIVTEFTQRYRLGSREPSRHQMAPINSQAETELWQMLDLISRSHPLATMVCSEGFQSRAGPGIYPATVFICGSPNIFQSVIVGVHATSFAELHDGLSWLAVDKVNVLGFELVSRQNSRLDFSLHEVDDALVVIQHSDTNFSTFGQLYVVLVLLDLVLLFAHLRATIETAGTFGCASLLGFQTEHADRASTSNHWMTLHRSLYRNSLIIALTIVSAVLSWLMEFPHGIISAWSRQSGDTTHALLSIMRLWMLVICTLNVLWSAVARFAEKQAYNLTKRTFVTPFEVLLTSVVTVWINIGSLSAVAQARREVEGQRIIDTETFSGFSTIANAYNEDLNGFATTSLQMLCLLFASLIQIVGQSLLAVVLLLLLKWVYYRRLETQQAHFSTIPAPMAVGDFGATNSEFLLRRTNAHRSAHSKTNPHTVTGGLRGPKPHLRLPLEDLLRWPARANCLVRSDFKMEVIAGGGQTYVVPHVYFDLGVVVSDAGFIIARKGFFDVIRRRLDVERFFAPTSHAASVSPLAVRPQPSRNMAARAASRVKFALETVSLLDSTTPSPSEDSSTVEPQRTLPDQDSTPMSRSMRRRKSIDHPFDVSSLTH